MPTNSPNRRHDKQFFYKYTTPGTADRIILSRSLRWSSPRLFNDPLDVPREAVLGFTTPELQTAIQEEMIAVLEGRSLTNDPRVRYLAQLIGGMEPGPQRDAMFLEIRQSLEAIAPATGDAMAEFRQVWEEMVPQLRILCVSEVADSFQMWAYYAANHTGVVLEFEASDELDSSLLVARPVTYSDDPPRLPGKEVWAQTIVSGERMDWNTYFDEYHHVKTSRWQHEREWRAITYADGGDSTLFTDRRFHPREFSGLYLGSQMVPDVSRRLVAEARSAFPRVRVYQARVDQASRALRFDRVDEN